MSRRQELFDAIKTELEKISGIAKVSTVPLAIEDARDRFGFPFLALSYAAERKETAAMAGPSAKRSELDIIVDVYVRDETDPLTALNTQIENVEKEIEDDVNLGKTFVVFARVVEVEMTTLSEETEESGGAFYGIGAVLVRIDYRHERAVP